MEHVSAIRTLILPGREQTNNRAELLAVIAAMKIYDGNLEIRSDSEHVVRIVTSRTRGETQKCKEENADQWNEYERERAETQSHKAS